MEKAFVLSVLMMLTGFAGRLSAQYINEGSHVVIIEKDIPHLEILLQGIKPGSRIAYLPHSKNPIAGILKILRQNAPVSSLHIFSHGKPGMLIFSSHKISLAELQKHEELLGAWKENFVTHGDLLLYGCEVAKGREGIAFIKNMAVLTGLDIAASDNMTGSVLKGGDWYFEVRSGRIESSLIISKRVTAQYPSVLNDESSKSKTNAR
jgi:hypothetical protein